MVLELGYANYDFSFFSMLLEYTVLGRPLPSRPSVLTIEQARNWLDKAGFADGAIARLTGNDVDTDLFWCTRNSVTWTKLKNALDNRKIVVAGTWVQWAAPDDYSTYHLRPAHYYAVVGYHEIGNIKMVVLREPYGRVGNNIPVQHGQEFGMLLETFTDLFAGIHYEQ